MTAGTGPAGAAADGEGRDLWPGCGFAALRRDEHGALHVTDDWLRLFLGRPELAPVEDSCQSERALHATLLEEPRRAVTPERLARLQDADARDNWAVFLRFRERLLQAGTVQAAYRGLFDGRPIDVPPLFIDLMVQAIVRGLLEGQPASAMEARAAELLFRAQRVRLQDGRMLAGDRDTLDLLKDTGGLGDLGRLLLQAKAPVKAVEMAVLGPETEARYWETAAQGRHTLLLDLSHEIKQDLGHGLQFTLANARSGLPALAAVLERWVAHMLGVVVHITPLAKIETEHWRWHLGLDAESTALLNDLYTGQPVDDARRARLLSLFELRFDNPAQVQPALAGVPVYLGLAHDAQGLLRLKPQNLLLNLPLATAS